MTWVRFAFAAFYFRQEAEYKQLSGLVIPALVGEQVVDLALDFTHTCNSFLFSDSLGRLPFQPTFSSAGLSDSDDSGESVTEDEFGWNARVISRRIVIGEEAREGTFGLVHSRARPHAEFPQVAGVISMTRDSWFTNKRVFRLHLKDKETNRVSVRSLARRIVPWPVSAVSLQLERDSNKWSFISSMSFGGNVFDAQQVVLDPSSTDVLFPEQLWASLGGPFQIVGDAKRLYATRAGELRLVPGRWKQVVLSENSLRFPSNIEKFLARKIDGIEWIPLRVRFVASDEVFIGSAILESYKHVYLDNVAQKIHLVPRMRKTIMHALPFPLVSTLVLDPRSLPLPEFDLHKGFSIDPAPESRIDDFLVPWSLTESALVSPDTRDEIFKTFEILLVRSFPTNRLEEPRVSTILRDKRALSVSVSVHEDVGFLITANLKKAPSSPGLTDWVVSVTQGPRDIRIRIGQEMALALPRPRFRSTSETLECPICLDDLSANDLEQTIPDCGHSFHFRCVAPWFRKAHNNCPYCRFEIPQAK